MPNLTREPMEQPSSRQNALAETMAGTVERVTFHNEETGFAVLKVKARGKRDLITVPPPSEPVSSSQRLGSG